MGGKQLGREECGGYWQVRSGTWASKMLLWQWRPTPSWGAFGKALSAGDPYSLASLRPHLWSTVSSFGLSSTKMTWAYWCGSVKRPQRQCRDWSICHMKRGWKNWVFFRLERFRKYLVSMYKYPMGERREDTDRLFSVASNEGTKGRRHTQNHRKFHLNTRKTYFMWGLYNTEINCLLKTQLETALGQMV